MSEKKKQEYTTGGLKNRQDVENALASAEYRPSQEVTDAASDLKQWQANRPGDYESAYQGRIDGLMEDLLDRKEFSYSYGADPLYRQYAQLYTQNARNASADAAAQAAALTVEGPRRNCDLHLVPRRCASLRLRLWGYGQITLRSLAKTFSGAKGNWMELEG